MTTDLLVEARIARPLPAAPRTRPDAAFACLPKLERLAGVLAALAKIPTPKSAEPPLFFFRPHGPAEWHLDDIRDIDPALARVGRELFAMVGDVLPELCREAKVRHAARAIRGLVESATRLESRHPAAAELAAVLRVADDVVVRAIHPGARVGFRLLARGIADVAQFHVLLANAVAGILPGPRPNADAVAAYSRGWRGTGEPPIASARFQFFDLAGLRADGSLASGFAGSDHWIWGHEPLAKLPAIDGERIVLLGEPAYPAEWEAIRTAAGVSADVECLEVMSANSVDAWLAARIGRPVSRPQLAAAA